MPPVLGIDLGTTNSVVAFFRDGNLQLLADELGQHRFPSVVTQSDTDTVWIGTKAVAVGAAMPNRMAYAVKRLIGRRFSDTVVQKACDIYPYTIQEAPSDAGVSILLGERIFSPEEISAMVLKNMKELVEQQFGFAAEEAVITVPAYFNHSQREATQRAARESGMSVLRLLNEPTAAALSLNLDREKEHLIAVYDFGGGTFDVSVIRIHGTVYEVLGTHGDTFLGGDDIDGLIFDELARLFEEGTGIKVSAFPLSRHRLRDAAEKAKQELSLAEHCSIYLPRLVGDESMSTEITRARVEDLARPLVERSLETCKRTLEDAKVDISDLTDLVLVGGQTRMPLIRKSVEEFFGKTANPAVNPDISVAEGAAREAAMLREGAGALLLDVTPITLGINILGDHFYPLIPKNTKIPVRKEHLFTTARDSQTRAKVVVLQGDSRVASENVRLGEAVLSGIRDQERFKSKIKVAFEIDADGILHVKVCNQETGEETEVTISDSFDPKDKAAAEKVADEESIAPTDVLAPPEIAGPFSQNELVDVLCFLHANAKTGQIEVHGEDRKGSLIMNEGEITHAKCVDLRGEDALERLLALPEGSYSFHSGQATSEQAEIDTPFESLIRKGEEERTS